LLGLGLAALGGCMIPLIVFEFFAPTLWQVAHVTPHAWGLEAFDVLVIDEGTVADILPFLGILLLFVGSRTFGLPTAGRVTIGADAGFAEAVGDIFSHLLLPTATLALVLLGEYMIIMRSSVVEVFSEDYILTAKAKGLSTFQIIRRHAFRNAMLPIVTLIALNLGFTVSGAIQVETVYSWPGLGKLTVDAVAQRDFPVLQGAFLLLAIAVIFANLVAELIYLRLDPRVTEA